MMTREVRCILPVFAWSRRYSPCRDLWNAVWRQKKGSSPVTVGRFRGRSSAQARQKGAAPTTFAFASPRICEGDAKAKAEGANRIYRERVENTDHQFERQIQPAFRMLESPCFASDSRLSVRFSPTVTGDEAKSLTGTPARPSSTALWWGIPCPPRSAGPTP